MDAKERSELVDKIYSIVSGADNIDEITEVKSAIDEWLADYDGGDTADELAADFQEYYNYHD